MLVGFLLRQMSGWCLPKAIRSSLTVACLRNLRKASASRAELRSHQVASTSVSTPFFLSLLARAVGASALASMRFRRHWSVRILVLAIPIALHAGAVSALPRMIITIDVESKPSLTLPEQVDAMCSDGKPCGLMEIARLLSLRGIAGTFFLNVYEYRAWGEPLMRKIASDLQSVNQDVALHTHPQWAYDPSRNGINQYSLDEQTTIVREGVQLLTAWTGRAVVAHRAGDYAADERTFEALARNGIRVDSSMFAGQPGNKLAERGLARNLVSTPGGVLEIPVTVYLRAERPSFLGDLFAPVTGIRKIDCDWFEDANEARSAIDGLVAADPQFIVVFLHSFSLITASERPGAFRANRHSEAILTAILDRAKERGVEIVTMRDVAHDPVTPVTVASAKGDDILPLVTTRVGLHRYALHRWRSAETGGKLAAVACLILFAVSVGYIVLLFARRRHAARSGINLRKSQQQGA